MYNYFILIYFVTPCFLSSLCISYICLLVQLLLTCFYCLLMFDLYYRHLVHIRQALFYLILFIIFAFSYFIWIYFVIVSLLSWFDLFACLTNFDFSLTFSCFLSWLYTFCIWCIVLITSRVEITILLGSKSHFLNLVLIEH